MTHGVAGHRAAAHRRDRKEAKHTAQPVAGDSPSTDESPPHPAQPLVRAGATGLKRSLPVADFNQLVDVLTIRARHVAVLGTGSYHRVLLVHHDDPDPREGLQLGAFKPESKSRIADSGFYALTGIDPYNHRYAVRNEAFWRLDQALGCALVPRSRRAVLDGQAGVLMDVVDGLPARLDGDFRIALPEPAAEHLRARQRADPRALQRLARMRGFTDARLEGQQLVVLNRPPVGRHAGSAQAQEVRRAIVALDFDDPMLRMLLTRLQWLDGLGAQVDRHPGNFAIARDARLRVTGLQAWDNDLCLGEAMHVVGPGVHMSQPLPDVIDAALHAALRRLVAQDALHPDAYVRSTLFAGLLNAGEVSAFRSRLRQVAARLDLLQAAGRVWPVGTLWSSALATRVLELHTIRPRIDALWAAVQQEVRRPDGPERCRQWEMISERLYDLYRQSWTQGLLLRQATHQAVVQWWWDGPPNGRPDPLREPLLRLQELWPRDVKAAPPPASARR